MFYDFKCKLVNQPLQFNSIGALLANLVGILVKLAVQINPIAK